MDYLKLIKSPKPYKMSYVNRDNKHLLGELEHKSRHLCWKYNSTDPNDSDTRNKILKSLFHQNCDVSINAPFYCDYGFNLRFKGKAFFNYDDVVLDSSPVIFGSQVNIAPHVCLSCVGHPLNYKQRRIGISISSPIILGDDVWIGANSFIKGGIKIGDHSVIGAGSIVTHSIPANVIAFGSPCKVYRRITDKDILNKNDIL